MRRQRTGLAVDRNLALGQALLEFSQQPYGGLLLGAVAVGLVAYAL